MSWSDLPEDILGLVVQRLYITDRVSLRGVCKNWRLAPCFNKLPWLLNYWVSPSRMICSLSDPDQKQPYIVEEKGRFIDGIICASRHGWLLFLRITSILINFTTLHRRVREYYVYNPHTKAVITLPALHELMRYDDYYQHWATFSSAPTSPNCMFAVATTSEMARNFFLSTYSIGDEAWKTVSIPCPDPRFICTPFMACMAGTFFFYSYGGDLSFFHIATKEWGMLLSTKHPSLSQWSSGKRRMPYFVAYGGHLHLVFLLLSDEGEKVVNWERENFFYWIAEWEEEEWIEEWEEEEWIEEWEEEEVVDSRAVGCDIFRYDWMDGDWKKMESLEGGALFLGDPLYGVPSYGVSAEEIEGEETNLVANRVYYRSSPTSEPRFLVYKSESVSESDQSESESSLSLSWPKESDESFDGYKSWIWMEPH